MMKAKLTEAAFGRIFVECFEAGGLPQLSKTSSGPLMAEVEFMQGRPDFVCASYPTRKSSHRRAGMIGDLLATSSKANVLSHLKQNSPRTVEYVRAQSGLTNGNFDKAVSQLRAANLVRVRRGSGKSQSLLLGPSTPPTEICVFELKLYDWRRAVFQAQQYRVAANRVVIVMPDTYVHRLEAISDQLREFGVGVISLDAEHGEFRTIIRARKRSPVSMRHYYFALGNYLKAVSQKAA